VNLLFKKIKKVNYEKSLNEYNKLSMEEFGEKFNYAIDKVSFENQLYNNIYESYYKCLKNKEDFEKKIIILEANLYGHEKRNYNFVIPIMLSIMSLTGTFFGISTSIKQTANIESRIAVSFVVIVIVIYFYLVEMRKEHRRYCNKIAYYKLSLEIVKKLYREYNENLDKEIIKVENKEFSIIKKIFGYRNK
jgi:hypothetical protein